MQRTSWSGDQGMPRARDLGVSREWRLGCGGSRGDGRSSLSRACLPEGTGVWHLRRPVLLLQQSLERRGGAGRGGQRGGGPRPWGLRTQRSPFSACSIHNGVIAVFQRKGLPDQELFSLNEGVR